MIRINAKMIDDITNRNMIMLTHGDEGSVLAVINIESFWFQSDNRDALRDDPAFRRIFNGEEVTLELSIAGDSHDP